MATGPGGGATGSLEDDNEIIVTDVNGYDGITDSTGTVYARRNWWGSYPTMLNI